MGMTPNRRGTSSKHRQPYGIVEKYLGDGGGKRDVISKLRTILEA